MIARHMSLQDNFLVFATVQCGIPSKKKTFHIYIALLYVESHCNSLPFCLIIAISLRVFFLRLHHEPLQSYRIGSG